mgnify:CR=1 FL=1
MAYEGNPKQGKEVMSIELLEKIILNIVEERDKNGLVSKWFKTFYTAHYNEILLYPHFEDLLKICKKYGVFSKLGLEMRFDILLFIAWIILLFFLRKC